MASLGTMETDASISILLLLVQTEMVVSQSPHLEMSHNEYSINSANCEVGVVELSSIRKKCVFVPIFLSFSITCSIFTPKANKLKH